MSSSPNQWRSTTLLSPFLKMWRGTGEDAHKDLRDCWVHPHPLYTTMVHGADDWLRVVPKAHPQGLGHSSHPLDCRATPSVSWWIEKRTNDKSRHQFILTNYTQNKGVRSSLMGYATPDQLRLVPLCATSGNTGPSATVHYFREHWA